MNHEGRNANALAHAVNKFVGNRFTARPFNRFSPDDSVWWLVPSVDFPAFKFTKLFFNSRPEEVPGDTKGTFCGMCVEKGLGPRIRQGFPKKLEALFQGPDWSWEDVTNRLSSEFPVLPSPSFIWTAASYVPPEKNVDSLESFLAQKETFKASQAAFQVVAHQSLALKRLDTNDKCFEISEYFSGRIQTAQTVAELIAALTSIPQSDWCWVDLYVGTIFENDSVDRLWDEHLRPWSDWLG